MMANEGIPCPCSSKAPAPSRGSREPPFTKPLTFLGDPDELTCPTADRDRELTDAGLGRTYVTCDMDASAADLKAAIMNVFKRESSTSYQEQFSSPDFKFSLAYVTGSGSQDLTFLRSDPSPIELQTLGATALYAKPSLILFCLEHTVRCTGCCAHDKDEDESHNVDTDEENR